MDELRVLLNVSLFGGTTSSSMLRGDSEIECLLEELNDGAFDDCVFVGKILVTLFQSCTNSQRVHRGFLAGGRNTQEKYIE
jgi:hypothetical protein